MTFQTILLKEHNEYLFELTLNRPEAKNALNEKVIDELLSAVQYVNQMQAKVVIMNGANHHFAAGADIKTMAFTPVDGIAAFSSKVGQLHDAIRMSSAIWLSAIEGFCLGGGLELALVTDIRIADKEAKFGFPEIKLSLLPGGGGTQRFLSLSGSAFANHFILTGDFFSAQKAYEMGLISEFVNDVQQLAHQIANKMIRYDSTTLIAIKQLISGFENTNLQPGLMLEREKFTSLFSVGQAYQGLQQFIQKKDVIK